MTWQAIARKDFRDAVRSKWLWGLTILFVAVFALPAILRFYFEMGSAPAQSQGGTTDAFIYLMKQGTSILIPLIGIVIAYASITRERESGSLKLLLSLPHSRDDVVFGKVVGRAAVMTFPIAIGFGLALVLMAATSLQIHIVNFLLFAVLTMLLGVVFVALAVGISAAASSGRRAMVASVGFFFGFVVLWNAFANQIVNLLKKYVGLSAAGQYQTLLFLKLLNPTQAYKTLVNAFLLDSAFKSRVLMFTVFKQQAVSKVLGNSLPIYLSDPFVVVYLLVWVFVPVAVGYLVFRDSDL